MNTVNQKTVAIFAPYYPPCSGGLERYSQEVAIRLHREHGWRVIVVTSGERHGKNTKTEEDGITVYRLGYSVKFSNTPFSLRWFAAIYKIFKEENPDIINIHMPVAGIGDIAYWLSGMRPFFVTYHTGSMNKGRIIPDLFVSLYEKLWLPIVLRHADKIICSSDWVRFNFLKKYTHKSTTVTPAVDSEMFTVDETKKTTRPSILFVAGLGRAEQYKGLATLLEAFVLVRRHIPEALLTVVGDGDMRALYEIDAERLGIQESVKFMGKLSGAALVSEYQKAHIFTLPTSNDSFPLVILEAMACGLPVISTYVGDIPKLVEDGKTGFIINSDDKLALAEKIVRLIENPETLASFALQSRQRVGKNFSWDKRAERYNELYLKQQKHEYIVSKYKKNNHSISDVPLTVAILTFNSSATVADSFESLIRQKNKNFKVLIVDDDSTDNTLEIVNEYRDNSPLQIQILRNGTHRISNGRNLALKASTTDYVSFLDSDDIADAGWTDSIIGTFDNNPETALISGTIEFFAYSLTGKAIALNDGVARRLFSDGILRFTTANCAFNKKILKTNFLFDKDFVYAEDLEIASRIQNAYKWIFVPKMKIHQTSRGTFSGYARQMYQYGMWKVFYGFVARDYRPLDFIPLCIGIISILASLISESLIPLLALIIFSLSEAIFIALLSRRELPVLILTFPAWLVKNIFWSLGIASGLFVLMYDAKFRNLLKSKRSKKIAAVQVASYYPPHLGGLERVAQEVSEQLARDGYAVTVLTSRGGAEGLPHTESQPNLTIKRLWSFDFAHTAIIPSLLWQLMCMRKPAIFHLHLAQAYVPEMVWLASRLRGIPYVVHFHLDVERSGTFGFIFDMWKRVVQPIIMRGAAHVITLSPDQSTLIATRYGIPADKITFIGNGVGEQFLGIGRTKREFHSPLRLLSVGRLDVQKRPERLIGALALIKAPVTLTMVGDGEQRVMLEKLAATRNLHNVTFTGVLRGDALLKAFREADVFVISSDREGMSLAILEAMGAGLPVVGSDVLGIHEAVEGIGILVANPSAETFASAIDNLAAHPERLQSMSAASIAKAQQYSWQSLVARLEEVYRSILV